MIERAITSPRPGLHPSGAEKNGSTNLAALSANQKERKRLEGELGHSRKLEAVGQLAAGIAHEVNNPLGILLLQANIMLEECEKDSEIRGDLATIVDQANRCKRIISGLLNFARQSRVVRQPASVPELVDLGE